MALGYFGVAFPLLSTGGAVTQVFEREEEGGGFSALKVNSAEQQICVGKRQRNVCGQAGMV